MNLFRNIGTWIDEPVWMDGEIVNMVVIGSIGDRPSNYGLAVGVPGSAPHTVWGHFE